MTKKVWEFAFLTKCQVMLLLPGKGPYYCSNSLTFFVFQEYNTLVPTSGPLHLLPPLLGKLIPLRNFSNAGLSWDLLWPLNLKSHLSFPTMLPALFFFSHLSFTHLTCCILYFLIVLISPSVSLLEHKHPKHRNCLYLIGMFPVISLALWAVPDTCKPQRIHTCWISEWSRLRICISIPKELLKPPKRWCGQWRL